MSRTKRFLGGIGFGYLSQALAMIVGLWLTPFLLRRVGQYDYGLWLVGTQIMFYLALLDLGIVALLPREAAFATGRASSIKEARDLPLIIGETAWVVLCQMPFVILAALVAWFALPSAWEGLRQPIGVVLLAFVLMFPLRIFSALLQGLQDLAYLGAIGVASFLISTALIVTLVLLGFGLYALAIGWAMTQLVMALAAWHRLHTHFHGVLPHRLPAFLWAAVRGRLKQGAWVSLNQIAQVLLVGTDVLIIGKLFGPAAVVPFVCTGKLIGVLANQPQMLMQAAGPALSQMRVSESRERLSQVCIALGQAMLMLSGAVVCVVLAVNHGFVLRWVGGDQYGGFTLTVLILVTMLLRHWNLTIGYTLFCFGYERRLTITAAIDGLVTVGGMFVLARLFGSIGAPLGSIIGVCLISLPGNLSALARESGMRVWSLIRPLLPWFMRFIFLLLITGALARVWMPSTLFWLAATALATSLVYAAVMFPLALRAPLGVYVRPRLQPFGNRVSRALRLSSSA